MTVTHLLCPTCAPRATKDREAFDGFVPVSHVDPGHIGAVWLEHGWLWCHHRIFARNTGPVVAPDWVLEREDEIRYNFARGEGR